MSAVQSVGPQALPALQEQVEQIIAEAKRQGASARSFMARSASTYICVVDGLS